MQWKETAVNASLVAALGFLVATSSMCTVTRQGERDVYEWWIGDNIVRVDKQLVDRHVSDLRQTLSDFEPWLKENPEMMAKYGEAYRAAGLALDLIVAGQGKQGIESLRAMGDTFEEALMAYGYSEGEASVARAAMRHLLGLLENVMHAARSQT